MGGAFNIILFYDCSSLDVYWDIWLQTCLKKYFLKLIYFSLKLIYFIFLGCFDVLISKITLKEIKKYFNIFLNKK
jgi:hypothetical protein